jgi:hypothetical protein
MTSAPKFKYTADETARLWKQKRKELHKAMNRHYLVRVLYACRWKYYSNEIYHGLVYAFLFWGPGLGSLLAILIAYLLFSNYTGS